ncbi:MAG: FKBP-type peptidyl-prolyl cis-trans isomerase [Pseudomonadota bacterium]
MALRPSLLAGSLILVLTACGSPGAPDGADPATEHDGAIEVTSEPSEESEMDAYFASHIPWDSERDGVIKTESGLEYIIVAGGPEGGLSPVARDTVEVHYEGRLARNGEKFDSSFDRGQRTSFPLNGVIAGWTEGLQYLSEGDDAVFYIPADLAYGQSPRPGGVIQPGDDLIFRVALNKVFPAPPPKAVDTAAWETYTPWDSEREGVQKTGTGLEYVVLESVEEGPSPNPEDQVVVFYEGRLDADGELFDSAFRRGEPAIFPAGRLIPGWVEALSLMKRGERWLIHVPSELGYGATGTPGGPIPPNSDLNFEVELMDVLPVQ